MRKISVCRALLEVSTLCSWAPYCEVGEGESYQVELGTASVRSRYAGEASSLLGARKLTQENLSHLLRYSVVSIPVCW